MLQEKIPTLPLVGGEGHDARLEMIGPAEAIAYLGPNRKNRKVRQHRVDSYARQMTLGQWKMTFDPIRFDIDGELLDGQHRLLAVVKCGLTFPFLVVRGLESDTFKVLDSGLGRNLGDALGITITNATQKVAVARVLWCLEAGGDPRAQRDMAVASRTDVADYYFANEQLIDSAIGMTWGIYQRFHAANKTAWSAFAVMGMRRNPVLTNAFVEKMISGADLGYGDPRLALRNWLANDRQMRNAGAHLALYIKIWNAWLEGERRQLASMRPDEPFPAMLAEPKRAMEELDVLDAFAE